MCFSAPILCLQSLVWLFGCPCVINSHRVCQGLGNEMVSMIYVGLEDQMVRVLKNVCESSMNVALLLSVSAVVLWRVLWLKCLADQILKKALAGLSFLGEWLFGATLNDDIKNLEGYFSPAIQKGKGAMTQAKPLFFCTQAAYRTQSCSVTPHSG